MLVESSTVELSSYGPALIIALLEPSDAFYHVVAYMWLYAPLSSTDNAVNWLFFIWNRRWGWHERIEVWGWGRRNLFLFVIILGKVTFYYVYQNTSVFSLLNWHTITVFACGTHTNTGCKTLPWCFRDISWFCKAKRYQRQLFLFHYGIQISPNFGAWTPIVCFSPSTQTLRMK